MIPTWNGLRDRDIILDLLVYTQLDSFEGMSCQNWSALFYRNVTDGSERYLREFIKSP